MKNESVQLSSFDCESLGNLIQDKLGDDCYVDVNDDNADYGFVNIAVECNGEMNDYDVEADDYDTFMISSNDENIGSAESLKEVCDVIVNHYKNNYMMEENMNRNLERRIATLEKLMKKNEEFEVDAEDVWNAANNAEKAMRAVRDAVEVIDDDTLRDLVADVVYALGMVKSRCDAIAEADDMDELDD